MTIASHCAVVEELIAELGDAAGELFFEIEIEEEECYRILYIAVWLDPEEDLVVSNVLLDVEIEKELEPLT